jgi:hypothetical protein
LVRDKENLRQAAFSRASSAASPRRKLAAERDGPAYAAFIEANRLIDVTTEARQIRMPTGRGALAQGELETSGKAPVLRDCEQFLRRTEDLPPISPVTKRGSTYPTRGREANALSQ